MWGKNLEKQLGVEKSQFEFTSPNHLNTVGPCIHVECGADFTLVMLTDYSVKAFGNNNNGQVNCTHIFRSKFKPKLKQILISVRS